MYVATWFRMVENMVRPVKPICISSLPHFSCYDMNSLMLCGLPSRWIRYSISLWTVALAEALHTRKTDPYPERYGYFHITDWLFQ